MLADAANRFTLLDPRTGKEATDLNRIAELNPNQHDLNILWSICLLYTSQFPDRSCFGNDAFQKLPDKILED